MSKFREIHNNFLFGEISRKARARTDSEEYNKSCQLMERYTPYINGGASKDPGTRFIKDMGTTFSPGLLPFVTSKDLGYYVTLDPSRANAGQYVRIFKVDGTEAVVNEAPFLSMDGIFSTFDTSLDPRGFQFSQFADALFVTHSSGKQIPFVINRVSDTAFGVSGFIQNNIFNNSDINGLLKVPYRDVNIGATTLTPSGTTGSVSLTASAAFFDVGMIGALIKLTHGTHTGVARINTFSSAFGVSVTTQVDFFSATPTTNWEEQAWSDYRGWPRTITLFEEKMVFGGNEHSPDTVWGSLTGNVFHMMGRKLQQDLVTDTSGINYFGDSQITDPYAFVVGADDANGIQWLAPSRSLYIGTLSTEYSGGGGNVILGTGGVGFRPQTNFGSSPVKVVKVGNEILYVSRDGRRVRTFRFSEENGSNLSFDLTHLADHMSRIGGPQYGFIDASYQQSRDTVWFINKNDYLVGLTYSRETGALAWHRHPIKDSQGIMGVASIPNSEGNYDTTAIIVKRTVDGSTVHYLETIGAPYEGDSLSDVGTLEEDIPMFLDSSKIEVLGGTTDTLTGYVHLTGEEVTVTKDGFFFGIFTVSAIGEIVLGQSFGIGTRFVVGLQYTAKIELNPVQGGGDFGAGEGSLKSLDTAFLDLYKTFDAKVGTTSAPTTLLPLILGDDIFTGIVEKNLHNSQRLENAVVIESSEPYPSNILFVVSRGEGND